MTKKQMLKHNVPHIVQLFSVGTSAKDISKKFDMHPAYVRYLLRTNGIQLSRSKYGIDEHYFDHIDCQVKAYFLGFLYADGNHYRSHRKYCVRLQIHEKDVEILYRFNQELRHNKPLRFRDNPKGTGRMVELEIANQHMSNRLLECGLIPRKTFSLAFPQWLSTELQRHFIRGYFDGDGSIGFYNPSPGGRGISKRGHISLVSTESFCKSVGDIIFERFGINPYIRARHPERNTNTRMLEYGGNRQVKTILDYLYADSTIHLERKYRKYRDFYYGSPKT